MRDPFRPPKGPYGPGNRGIEYATAPGTLVVAIAPGKVVYAGVIAGERYVTVRHPDGLRSSYSYLATIAVRVGDAISGETVVGLAGPRLHLGVRRGDNYLDPATLWGRPAVALRPVLVPLDGGSVGDEIGAAPPASDQFARSRSPSDTVAERAVHVVGGAAGSLLAW